MTRVTIQPIDAIRWELQQQIDELDGLLDGAETMTELRVVIAALASVADEYLVRINLEQRAEGAEA